MDDKSRSWSVNEQIICCDGNLLKEEFKDGEFEFESLHSIEKMHIYDSLALIAIIEPEEE